MKLEPAPVRYAREPRAREGRRWGKNRKLENNAFPTKDTALIGAAGVHFVVSELSLRGLIALPTIRNTAGVDVLVTDKKGTWQTNLQVKASRSRVGFWPIGKKYQDWVGPNNYYVFLRYDGKGKAFEVFLESSHKVAELVDLGREQEKKKGLKEWAPCYYPKGLLLRVVYWYRRTGLSKLAPPR